MSDTTWSNVVAMAPELSTLSVAQQNLIIADVKLLVSTAFGDYQEIAQRYLAAHMGTILNSSNKSATGGLQSESIGDASISYGSIQDASRYDTTAYGRKYKEILDTCIIGFTSVTL
jgi:hypothetical protein